MVAQAGEACIGDRAQPVWIESLRRWAEQGDAISQLALGVIYSEGKRVPQDYQQAVKWYRRAADQGNADAQLKLGLMYTANRGGPVP